MSDLRTLMAGDASRLYQKILTVVEAALEKKKTAWVDCPRCHMKKLPLEYEDVDSAIKAYNFLVEHGHGKPAQAAKNADTTTDKPLEHLGVDELLALREELDASAAHDGRPRASAPV